MTSVIVRHTFETAHRLPQLGGKCHNLHGHSWSTEIVIRGDVDPQGIVVDFGALKSGLRGWIDSELDHGTMLGHTDPLVPALLAQKSKVFQFGVSDPSKGLEWPTVENVAELLLRVSRHLFCAGEPDVEIVQVRVDETRTNSAEVGP